MSVFQQVCTIWISPNSSRPPSLSSTFCSWFQFTILDGAFQWMGLRHMRSLTNSCTLVSRAMSFRIPSLQVWRKWTISKSHWRCFASCSKYSDGSVLWTPMVSSKLEIALEIFRNRFTGWQNSTEQQNQPHPIWAFDPKQWAVTAIRHHQNSSNIATQRDYGTTSWYNSVQCTKYIEGPRV